MPFPFFAAIFLVGALGVYLTQTVASDPSFIAFLGTYSPWLAFHATTLGFVASGLILAATIALPVILSLRDDGGMERAQETINGWLLTVLQPLLFVAWVVSLGYLFGLGFFGAKHALFN